MGNFFCLEYPIRYQFCDKRWVPLKVPDGTFIFKSVMCERIASDTEEEVSGHTYAVHLHRPVLPAVRGVSAMETLVADADALSDGL